MAMDSATGEAQASSGPSALHKYFLNHRVLSAPSAAVLSDLCDQVFRSSVVPHPDTPETQKSLPALLSVLRGGSP